jgi:hypothetical protein
MVRYPSGLRGLSAKQVSIGSNPILTSLTIKIMLLGSYYSKCLLNELKNKPYKKKNVLIKDIIEKTIIVSIIITGLLLTK